MVAIETDFSPRTILVHVPGAEKSIIGCAAGEVDTPGTAAQTPSALFVDGPRNAAQTCRAKLSAAVQAGAHLPE